MSLASRWTLTPEGSCPPGKPENLVVRSSEHSVRSARTPRTSFLEIRLVHESTHSDVIHDAQG